MGESSHGQSLVGRYDDTCFTSGFLSLRWLGDASILAITNKWRKERGLPEIPSHLLDRRQEGTT